MKQLLKNVMMMVLTLTIFVVPGMSTYASDQNTITILKMVKTIEAVEAKKEPRDDAEVFESFEEGRDLLVVEDVDGVWYSIAYQGEIGYVKQSSTEDAVLYGEEEQQEVMQEIEEVSEETTVLVEALEREQIDTKKTVVWGVIIGILVVGIMAVGVLGKIKEDKEKNKEE